MDLGLGASRRREATIAIVDVTIEWLQAERDRVRAALHDEKDGNVLIFKRPAR